ncbi:Putative glycine/D-amino acid oxidase (deaminating) [Campylobacter concisus UNSWCD]|nr:Putative glycine/D-amino acid oxidase (deaminating) [Campylobacter concisus UNSWCD]
MITDLVLDRPLCIERSLFFELHPARFLIRKLKKRTKGINLTSLIVEISSVLAWLVERVQI